MLKAYGRRETYTETFFLEMSVCTEKFLKNLCVLVTKEILFLYMSRAPENGHTFFLLFHWKVRVSSWSEHFFIFEYLHSKCQFEVPQN